jgi:hypothetical protein
MKRLIAGLMVVAMAEAVSASTVAYWPLAGENGVRTTVADVFPNIASPGTMDAVPISIKTGVGETGIGDGGSTYCPIGTNAFPLAYGVYDPVAGMNRSAATGLYFQGVQSSHCGALRVVDPDALKVSNFTVEYFMKPDASKKSTWQFMAVMPLLFKDSDGTRKTGGESWSMAFGNNVTPSTGGKISGSGLFWMRFATTNSVGDFAASEIPRSLVKELSCFDGRWHHIAVTVSNGVDIGLYLDYGLIATATIANPIEFAPDGDLYIGGTPHNDIPYYGSMAHFRISDEVLPTEKFLHFTRTERAANEADDVVLHINFEDVEGIAGKGVVFNQAATGSAIHFGATNNASTVGYAAFSTDVYTNKLHASRRDIKGFDNMRSMNRTNNSAGDPYLAWWPSEDIFHDSSFTVEFFMKDSDFGTWSHLFKRRVDENDTANQFWIGGYGTSNRLKCDFCGKTVTDTTSIADGKWNHIAAVYDKSSHKLTFYRNWSKVGESTVTENAKNLPEVRVKPITLMGCTPTGTTYTGLMDEVRITKRALKVEEFLTPEHGKGFMLIIK